MSSPVPDSTTETGLVGGLPVGVLRLDVVVGGAGRLRDVRVASCNDAAADALGVPRDALVGRLVFADLPELSAGDLWGCVVDVWTHGVPRVQRLPERPGAPRRSLLLTSHGDHLLAVVISQDQVDVADYSNEETGDLLTRALDASHDAFAIYRVSRGEDEEIVGLHLIFLNAAGSMMVDGERASLYGRELGEVYAEADASGLRAAMTTAMLTSVSQELRLEVTDGPWHGILDGLQVPLGGDLLVSTWRDVTDSEVAERTLAAAYEETAAVRATLQTALDATSDAFAVYEVVRDVDMNVVGLRLIAINAAGVAPLAASAADLLGRDFLDFYPEAVEAGLWDVILRALGTGEVHHHHVHVHSSEGEWTAAYDNTVAPSGDDRLVITWRDVTDVVATSRALSEMSDKALHHATHDSLTGLANRTLFSDRLEEALREQRSGHRTGLVFLDLDHFKNVNDTWGHLAGDKLLVAVADRLTGLVRRGDSVARLGGDEFVLVLRDLPQEWSSEGFLTRVGSRLGEPVLLENATLTPSASMGLVLSPPAPPDAMEMLREADMAMYESKRAGRGRATIASQGRPS